jgi:hypothetical protein
VRLVAVALREEGPDRAVDEARDQHLAVRQASFALEEAAGNLAGSRGLLLEVDREREEIYSLARFGARGGDQHDGVTVLDHDGPGRLLGQTAGFESHGASADFDGRGFGFEPIRHGTVFSWEP